MAKGVVGEAFAAGEGEFGEGELLEEGDVAVLELEAVVEIEGAESLEVGEVLEMFALQVVAIGKVEFGEFGKMGEVF